MGRACSVCKHPKRTEIETAIVNSVPYRTIAREYGLTHVSISRHVENGHMAQALEKAGKKRADETVSLFDRLRALQGKALNLLDTAISEGKTVSTSPLLRELRSQLELEGRITGELETKLVENNVGVIFLPEKMTPAQWVEEHGGELAPEDYEVEPVGQPEQETTPEDDETDIW